MGNFFGTDGVRGIANKELTCETALKIGKAAAKVLTSECNHKPKIIIGKDTRISSDMLEAALLAGICSVGAEGVPLGVVPTPAVAYLVKKYNADAGVMISASHNSFEFNGIKLFDRNGFKLPDAVQEQIEKLILNESQKLEIDLPIGEHVGKITHCDTAVKDYVDYLISTSRYVNKNLKIAVDCANGSSSITAKDMFEKLGVHADILFSKPDGININENCGSTYLKSLSKYVTENNCDLGIAFDGDADRCLCIDEKGNTMDGDAILAICALDMKKEGTLENNTLVGTVMSNLGLKKFCEKNDINFSETKVGDRYVLEKMQSDNYNIGGEQSGHVIFLNYSTTGDGQLTAVQILNILSKSDKEASWLTELVKKYPQKSTTVNIMPNQKGILDKKENIKKYLDSLKKELGEFGRIVVRESGTEPKIRIMVEHENFDKIDEIIKNTVEIIKENLN